VPERTAYNVVVRDGVRMLHKLGEGSMGEVYLADNAARGRREAVKILRRELAADPRMRSRFRRETRAIARLDHPHIVALYETGALPDGRLYLAMEYAEGDRLDAVVAQGAALPVARVVELIAELAGAIDHASSRGVVHRDLKPCNLIVSPSGPVKVLDFGIAKIIAPDHTDSMRLTDRGEMVGTTPYMAPEQLGAGAIDGRADLYALGCIAFELLAGAPPFTGSTMEVMHAHLCRVPERAGARRAGVPAALDDAIARCLAKDPGARFATGAELVRALAPAG
jgi:serine/threonine protein kinase